jgi:hypothetical protein
VYSVPKSTPRSALCTPNTQIKNDTMNATETFMIIQKLGFVVMETLECNCFCTQANALSRPEKRRRHVF